MPVSILLLQDGIKATNVFHVSRFMALFSSPHSTLTSTRQGYNATLLATQIGPSIDKKGSNTTFGIQSQITETNPQYDAIELARRIPLPPSSSTVFMVPSDTPNDKESLRTSSREEMSRNLSSLAPVDGGFGAWSFVGLPVSIPNEPL